ncbi:hypothetical protein BGX20_011300 [Mortierella sp. AD010]|nr:hypothetical protein BGX20_011300 [Mortierella sp. AD010]
MASYGDDMDDDDFEIPSTPHSIRPRNAAPPKTRFKHHTPLSSSQHKQRPKQNILPLKRKLPLAENGQDHEHRTTSSQPTVPALPEHSAAKPRKVQSLSLKKPGTKKLTSNITKNGSTVAIENVAPISIQQPTVVSQHSIHVAEDEKLEGVIVLDSDSDGDHADMESTQRPISPELDLTTTQISGVYPFMSPKSKRVNTDLREQSPSTFDLRCTQESIVSSQGSDDENQAKHMVDQQEYASTDCLYSETNSNGKAAAHNNIGRSEAHWSLSPNTTNPFLSDLVASPAASIAPLTSPRRGQGGPASSSFETSFSGTLESDGSLADNLETQLNGYSFDPDRDMDETLECVICGKMLAHLDRARIEYHINTCIDEQQIEQQTVQSLDMDSTLPRVSSSEGMFAGEQVDYLTRVKRCPICKQVWPLKGKGKAGSVKQPRKPKQKVEHMKRCAKAHNRTVQSLVYQIRLLKEQYERSLMLGKPTESDSITPSQETSTIETDQCYDESDPPTDGSSKKLVSRKLKTITMAKKHVVSLSENADADFASDAIITTVNAPAPLRTPKISKLQQMEQDQQDENLQMALAISMSMESSQAGSRPDSPFNTSSTSTWSMVPLEIGVSRKGSKRRKQSERERNETTVLPYAEVQHLIQANVQALLFPETEDERSFPHEINSLSDQEDGSLRLMRTPPWGPSRFSNVSRKDLELSLSQSSEPDASSPTKSLWRLSHLKDTNDVEGLDLSISECNDDTNPRNQDGQGSVDGESTLTFDREKYSSRFMKRFIRLDSEGFEKGKEKISSTESVTISPRPDSEGIASQNQPGSSQPDNKILESLKRHPIAAGLRPPEPPDIVILEDENELDSSDEESQDLDGYQAPPSPLLRYSNRFELTRSPSYVSRTIHSPQHSRRSSIRSNYSDPRSVGDQGGNEALDQTSFGQAFESPVQDDDQFYQQEDAELEQTALMIYSPGYPTSAPVTPKRTIVAGTSSVEPDAAHTPNASFSIQNEEDTSFSLWRMSLPPPLDFTKMGYHDPNFLSEPTEPLPDHDPLLEPTTPTGGDEDDRSWLNSKWSTVTTPKRNSAVNGEDVGDGNAAAKIPGRPRNAHRTRVGLPVPPSAQPPQEQRPKRSALYGLPLLKSAIQTTSGANNDDQDSDVSDFEEPTNSQRTTIPFSQTATATNSRANKRAGGKQAPRTPSCASSNRQGHSQAESSTSVAPTSILGPPPSKTPSKRKKSQVVLRAEAYAAESAKAVANLRAQKTMPDYNNMSVARLRLAATTFGLKANTKRLLVDQLTAIWKSVNAERDDEEGQEQNENEDENQNNNNEIEQVDDSDDGGPDINGYKSDNLDNLGDRDKYSRCREASSSLAAEIPSSQYSLGMDGISSLDYDMGPSSDVAEGSASHNRRRPPHALAFSIGGAGESPVVSEEEEQSSGGEATEDENEDTSSLAGIDSEYEHMSVSQNERSENTPDLERQLYAFLSSATHLRKQFLTYKPLDLEQVWEECQALDIKCTRQQLQRYLDQQGIINIVPPRSKLKSWRSARAAKQKRVAK